MFKYIRTFLMLTLAAGFILISACSENSAPEGTANAQPESVKITFAEITERENSILNSYELLDIDRGLYRIPISKAMELISKSSQE